MIQNLTKRLIILPSRHRLQPGANPSVPDECLSLRKNVSFVTALKRQGRISVSEQLPPTRPLPENIDDLTRLDLARMMPSDVFSLAVHLGIDPRAEVDDVRVAISRRLFS